MCLSIGSVLNACGVYMPFNEKQFNGYAWGKEIKQTKNIEMEKKPMRAETVCLNKGGNWFLTDQAESIKYFMNSKSEFDSASIEFKGSKKCEGMKSMFISMMGKKFTSKKAYGRESLTWDQPKLEIKMSYEVRALKNQSEETIMTIFIKHKDSYKERMYQSIN
jgi:hypothetical protein